MTDEECDCPSCSLERLFPPHENPEDRPPVVVGIDVSTKYIAIGAVPAMGDVNDMSGFGFQIESKRDTERCAEAADKALTVLTFIDQSVDVTSVAIEMPRGFGGKLIPIVGAITSVMRGGNVEWYAPAQWQSIIKKNLKVTKDDVSEHGVKKAIHNAVIEADIFGPTFGSLNEDMRDALCIALAHRTETLSSTGLNEYDIEWLRSEDGR